MTPTRCCSRALRSRAFIDGHGPSSNARRAARTARSTSSVLPTANVATSSLAAGFTCVHVPPSDASHHVPSMYSWPPLTPSSSRFGSTEMLMTPSPCSPLDDVDVRPVLGRHQVHALAHELAALGVGQQVGVLH